MLFVLIFAVLTGGAALLVPGMLKRSVSTAFDAERELEAQMLASNLRELAKYLVLYEKVFYTGESGLMTLGSRPDPLVIDAGIRGLWRQSFTEVDSANLGLARACGGYTLGARYIGRHEIGGRKVFCPLYFRTHLLSGRMAENMVFEQWANPALNPVVNKLSEGSYELVLDFSKAFDANSARIVPLDLGQRLLAERVARKLDAKVYLRFKTDSSGFRALTSERYLSITAQVSFDTREGGRKFVEDSESMMMAFATPKDYALFLPFPSAARKWTEVVRASNPAGVGFYGRVYFRGDLDLAPGNMATALEALPVFNDVLILSGTLKPAIPTAASLDVLKRKFRKGLVTNLSGARFVLDGACAGPQDTTTRVRNEGSIACRDPVGGAPMTIERYISNLNGSCSSGRILVESQTIKHFDPAAGVLTANEDRCHDDGSNNSGQDKDQYIPSIVTQGGKGAMTVVDGGFSEVEVAGPTAILLTPAGKLTIRTPASVYGLVLGGSVDALAGVNFYSLNALRPGLPRIEQVTIGEINADAGAAYAGISVPLVNMPVIYSSREGVK